MSSKKGTSDTRKKQPVVLVTGGKGLVGCALRRVVKEAPTGAQWYFASSRSADLSVDSEARALFEQVKPTYVVHLAAMVDGGLSGNMRHSVEMFRANQRINDNVLALAHEYGVKKCVSCLSTCVFPDQTAYPINEKMMHDGPPHRSNLGYATAKRDLDVLNRLYHDQYGCGFTSVIPTNVFGPHDNYHLEDSHVIPGLIHRCYLAKKKKQPFVVRGSGKPLRQFIYSIDLARLILWTLLHYNNDPQPLILSVDESAEVSIEHVARSIARTMDYEEHLVFDENNADDSRYRETVSNSKLQRLYDEREGTPFQFTPFDKAMVESVHWFIQNYDEARK